MTYRARSTDEGPARVLHGANLPRHGRGLPLTPNSLLLCNSQQPPCMLAATCCHSTQPFKLYNVLGNLSANHFCCQLVEPLFVLVLGSFVSLALLADYLGRASACCAFRCCVRRRRRRSPRRGCARVRSGGRRCCWHRHRARRGRRQRHRNRRERSHCLGRRRLHRYPTGR